MRAKQFIMRMPEEYFDMLEEIEKMDEEASKREGRSKMSKPDIVKMAIQEYYARKSDRATDDAYMALLTSTLNNLITPYFNTLISSVQKLSNNNAKVDESIRLETLMNRMCFNLLFRSDELPEDEELLYKVLIKRTPFDDVLERVAKEKDTYNSVPDEADGSK